MEYMNRRASTDEIIYRNFEQLLEFRIGDVRYFHSISAALSDADVVFNAAALKQVPTFLLRRFRPISAGLRT